MNEFHVGFADWNSEREALIALRTEVFVIEQQVPVDLEVDGMDPYSRHIKATNRAGLLIGTARLLPDHYIGRMCVVKAYRKRGVGGLILKFIIDYADQQGIPELLLNAQLNALPFYQRFGFSPVNDIFLEAGIEHQQMTLTLAK